LRCLALKAPKNPPDNPARLKSFKVFIYILFSIKNYRERRNKKRNKGQVKGKAKRGKVQV
jgi:hypothetical protein